jgi:type VI secretion system protein ImpB
MDIGTAIPRRKDPVVAIQNELPRSRLTLTYRTTINGEPETVNLPFRLLLLGDFSHGSGKDCQNDLETRRLRSISGSNLNSVMREMEITLKLPNVKNCIDADSGELPVRLPIESIRSFSPDEIIKHVPKLKALLLLRQLLQELQGQIDNQSALRKNIQDLFAYPELLANLKAELSAFGSLALPPPATALSEPAKGGTT